MLQRSDIAGYDKIPDSFFRKGAYVSMPVVVGSLKCEKKRELRCYQAAAVKKQLPHFERAVNNTDSLRLNNLRYFGNGYQNLSFELLFQHTEFLANLSECGNALVEVFGFVCG